MGHKDNPWSLAQVQPQAHAPQAHDPVQGQGVAVVPGGPHPRDHETARGEGDKQGQVGPSVQHQGVRVKHGDQKGAKPQQDKDQGLVTRPPVPLGREGRGGHVGPCVEEQEQQEEGRAEKQDRVHIVRLEKVLLEEGLNARKDEDKERHGPHGGRPVHLFTGF